MSSKRRRVYEEHLYYPFYINHKYVQLSGKEIREMYMRMHEEEVIILTNGDYYKLLDRISRLEELLEQWG